MQTSIFKVKLKQDKKISRKIEMPEDVNLYKLAAGIVKAFDFDFDHCFGFYDKTEGNYYKSEKIYELFVDIGEDAEEGVMSVKKTKIKDVWKEAGEKMLFLFDYGDNWEFIVQLAGFGEKDKKTKYPNIFEKIGEAPEQY